MAVNLMGNFTNNNEHDLIADLIEEAIEQRGVTTHYIVREQINPDYLLGEASMSAFKKFFEVPMFAESVEHFNGNGDINDEFGTNHTDTAIFQVGIRRFKIDVCENSDLVRPREGDLIYLPMSDSLWEIGKVKMDQKYFQAGRNYSYRLNCKLFNYSHEDIEDDTESDFNKLGTSRELDDDGMKRLLGILPSNKIDETGGLQQEAEMMTIPNDSAFGF